MEQETGLLHFVDLSFGLFIGNQKCLYGTKTSKFTQLLPNKMIGEQRAGKKKCTLASSSKNVCQVFTIREKAPVESQAHVTHSGQFSKAQHKRDKEHNQWHMT